MPRRQLMIAIAISALVHALLFVGTIGIPFVRFAANVPIEIVEMKKHEPAPPLAGSPKPPSSPSPPRAPASAHAKAAPKPAAPAAPDLRGVGPSGANLTLVLRTASLRTSVHREGVDALLSLLPDYHTLLDGTTLTLFDDLSALLIATPDPRDVAATFLAARHRDDPRFVAIVHKKLGPDDPRVFRALSPDLTVLGPPQIVSAMDDTDSPETQRWMSALDDLHATRHDQTIEIIGHLPERQVTLALTLARAFAPQPVAEPADMQ